MLFWTFRAIWAAVVVVAPALGVWVASSLAAYRNGPVWLVCAAGLLLFPIVPVAWDMLSELLRRRRAHRRDRRVLTTWDRIVLRTLVVNLAVLTALLWSRPEAVFTAISTRGDWFLEGAEHPLAGRARAGLLQAADGLQWLYEAAHDNQYAELIETKPAEAPVPQPVPEDDAWSDPWERPPQPSPAPEPGVEPTPTPEPAPTNEPQAASGAAWPSPAEVHPAVLAMPEAARSSIDAVGRHLAASEPDPARRIKAIHDFVATHLAYDAASYLNRDVYPDQRAEAVFASRLAVCAGYANLMRAIAAVTGDEVVVVVGDARGCRARSRASRTRGTRPASTAAGTSSTPRGTPATSRTARSSASTAPTTCSCRRR
ncbi:transglutaminase domain-containing protein [Nannocystis pusilla]|uniref:transglutaminase domain-containing protein n=1 Tax=Nannocystis pusilla TaxID=889268 RepID=UPI003B7C6A70